MKAVLIGPPGAGKGVYAQYFREKYCIPHISTGDIFREEISKGTDLGLRVKPYLEKGLLVPDEIVIEVVKKRLGQPDVARGFILDGFPRTIAQAKALDEIVNIDVAIHIAVSEETAVKRLSGRVICPVCGRVYNIYFEPKPKIDMKCDYDGAELSRRKDDEPDVVRQRYRVFYETFNPVIEYYLNNRKLMEINGERPLNEALSLLEEMLIRKGILKIMPCKQ
ncbi:MAG: adenylate kinase [Desulfurococcaceae archaeon]